MNTNEFLRDRIPYTTDLSPDHLTAIQKQVDRSERSTPMVFGGRTDIVNRVKSRLIARENDSLDLDDESYTIVIQGAPGSGKTSLINHLSKQVRSGDIATPAGARVIRINGSACRNEKRFLAAVFNNIREDPDNLLATRTTKSRSGVNLGVAGSSIEIEKMNLRDYETLGIRTVWEMLEKAGVTGTVLLCVDETQNLKPEGVNEILENLHEANTGSLKIVPLFAGLLDTAGVLSEAGLSRLAGIPTSLGSLSKSETWEVIIKTLHHDSLGLSGSISRKDQNYLVTSLAMASDRWPRHLHYYMQGVLLEILEDQQRGSPRQEIDLNRVLDHGHKARIDYYQQQLEDLQTSVNMDQWRALTRTLENLSANQNIPYDPLEDSLSERLEGSKSEVNGVISVAVHKGIMSRVKVVDGIDIVQIPIPSLQTFFQCGRDPEKTLNILQENHAEQLTRELAGMEG